MIKQVGADSSIREQLSDGEKLIAIAFTCTVQCLLFLATSEMTEWCAGAPVRQSALQSQFLNSKDIHYYDTLKVSQLPKGIINPKSFCTSEQGQAVILASCLVSVSYSLALRMTLLDSS